MNKYILGGAGLLIIVGALFFTTRNDIWTTSTNDAGIFGGATTTANMVAYTNDGFSPSELTVKSGTTVTFFNQSDSPMWVASANHPTHLLYPEFDEKASVAKGGLYSFTFNKVGTHPYHNHVLLGKYGKIIVE